ncbi:MAG: cbb3-type cytochrome c oxidase subunit I, partial [Acidimicrobiales bacterium]
MTVLEAPIETHTEVVLMPESDIASIPSSVGNVMMTGDHTVIGRLYVVSATIFGLFTLAIGSLVAFEQANLDDVSIFGGQEVYAAMFGLFRFSLLFLVVVPLMMGIATAVVPREVQAPSIAFPRAAAAALWTFVISGAIFVGATIYDGGIVDGADAQATELSILALGGIVLALCLASVCVLTTIIAQRAEGMGLGDIPIFSWSMLVAGTMWLATLAVLLGNIALVWVDLRGLGTQFWEDGAGALQILGWVTDQTAIY